MFADLFRRLASPGPVPLPDSDARLALSALLVRIARTDGRYDQREIARIDRILAQRFGLNPVAAAQLRASAEAVEKEAPDTVRFTRAIKDAVPLAEREAIIAASWAVVLADGTRAAAEDALMRQIAALLGINDADSNRIRLSLGGD